MTTVCEFCKNKKALFKCDGCNIAFYCGSECQKMDWKLNHKHMCLINGPGDKRKRESSSSSSEEEAEEQEDIPCTNETDFITLDNINDLDDENVWSLYENGHHFCYNLDGLTAWINASNGQDVTNPATNRPFTDEQLASIVDAVARRDEIRKTRLNKLKGRIFEFTLKNGTTVNRYRHELLQQVEEIRSGFWTIYNPNFFSDMYSENPWKQHIENLKIDTRYMNENESFKLPYDLVNARHVVLDTKIITRYRDYLSFFPNCISVKSYSYNLQPFYLTLSNNISYDNIRELELPRLAKIPPMPNLIRLTLTGRPYGGWNYQGENKKSIPVPDFSTVPNLQYLSVRARNGASIDLSPLFQLHELAITTGNETLPSFETLSNLRVLSIIDNGVHRDISTPISKNVLDAALAQVPQLLSLHLFNITFTPELSHVRNLLDLTWISDQSIDLERVPLLQRLDVSGFNFNHPLNIQYTPNLISLDVSGRVFNQPLDLSLLPKLQTLYVGESFKKQLNVRQLLMPRPEYSRYVGLYKWSPGKGSEIMHNNVQTNNVFRIFVRTGFDQDAPSFVSYLNLFRAQLDPNSIRITPNEIMGNM